MGTHLSLPAGEDLFCDLPNGMRLCYRSHGPLSGQPLMLVVGLGLQLIYWSPQLIHELVNRGFRVIVFDNRDVGRSSRANMAPPAPWRLMLRQPDSGNYDLGDMAQDALSLLDHLGIVRAHLVGMSMGGMIAQTLAARHPRRVASLTSIFSTTGARRVGQPALSTMLKLLKAPPASKAQAIERFIAMSQHIGPSTYEFDERDLHAYATRAWDRGHGETAHEGIGRQIAAIMKSGDRTPEVRQIKAPTLVIHGERDPMVHPSGGLATADAVPGAHFVTVRGMGHAIPEGVIPYLSDLIDGHAKRSLGWHPRALHGQVQAV